MTLLEEGKRATEPCPDCQGALTNVGEQTNVTAILHTENTPAPRESRRYRFHCPKCEKTWSYDTATGSLT